MQGSYEKVALEDIVRLSNAQDTLRESTEFSRRIIALVSGAGGATLSLVCPRCRCFPLDDYICWVSSVMVLHMSASVVHAHRQNIVAPHVCLCCTRRSTEHLEHIRHSSRVSKWCTSNIVAHVEFLSFCGETIAREWVSGNTSPRPLRYKRFLPLRRGKEFVISVDVG